MVPFFCGESNSVQPLRYAMTYLVQGLHDGFLGRQMFLISTRRCRCRLRNNKIEIIIYAKGPATLKAELRVPLRGKIN